MYPPASGRLHRSLALNFRLCYVSRTGSNSRSASHPVGIVYTEDTLNYVLHVLRKIVVGGCSICPGEDLVDESGYVRSLLFDEVDICEPLMHTTSKV